MNLKDAYDILAALSAKQIRFTKDEVTWYVSAKAVYACVSKGPDKPVEAIAGSCISTFSYDRVFPENAFKGMYDADWKAIKEAAQESDKMLFNAGKLYKLKQQSTVDGQNIYTGTVIANVDMEHDCCTVGVPAALKSISDVTCCLCVAETGLIAILLKNDSETLYTTMLTESAEKPELFVMQADGIEYTPTKWDSKTRTYKKVKEKKMAIPELPKLVKVQPEENKAADTPISTMPELPVDDVDKAADDAAAELMNSLDIKAKDEEPKKRSKKKEEQAETQPADTPPFDTATEQESKPKRVNKPKKSLKDLSPVIEAVSCTVPDDITPEEVTTEIRQLRDLIKAAVCRMANLSTAYISKNAEAAKKLEALSCLLKQ